MNEVVIAAAIGVLTSSGVWLLLRPRTFQVAIGLSLLSYAVNLFIFCMGRLRIGLAPIVAPGGAADPAAFADPLGYQYISPSMAASTTPPATGKKSSEPGSLP